MVTGGVGVVVMCGVRGHCAAVEASRVVNAHLHRLRDLSEEVVEVEGLLHLHRHEWEGEGSDEWR